MVRFYEIRKKADERDIRNRNETLGELCKILKLIHEGVDLPCLTLAEIELTYYEFFFLTGNLSRNYKRFGHMFIDRNATHSSDSEDSDVE